MGLNIEAINAMRNEADLKKGLNKDGVLEKDEKAAIKLFAKLVRKAHDTQKIDDETYNVAMKEIFGLTSSNAPVSEEANTKTETKLEAESVTEPVAGEVATAEAALSTGVDKKEGLSAEASNQVVESSASEVLTTEAKPMKETGLAGTPNSLTKHFANVKEHDKQEVRDLIIDIMEKMTITDIKSITEKNKSIAEKDVKDYLLSICGNDNQLKNYLRHYYGQDEEVIQEAIKTLKDYVGITTRRLDREVTAEALKKTGSDDLKKLSDQTKSLLKQSKYLNNHDNHDGTYDLSAISQAIRKAVGANEYMDYYEDGKKSEMQEAIYNLNVLFNCPASEGVNEKVVKELMELCHIKEAPKSRNAKEAFLGDIEKPTTEGAVIGAALGCINIKQVADISKDFVHVVAKQSVTIPMAAALPAAIGIEFVLTGLMNLIFGMKKGERTCFDYEKAQGKTFEQYVEYVKYTEEDELKAKAIIALAKIYVQKFGADEWNKAFVADMKDMAGNDVLNCREFMVGRSRLAKKLSAVADYKQVVADDKKDESDPHSYSQKDVAAEDPVDSDIPVIDGSRTSWTKIAESYDCLVKDYGLYAAIRMVKIAQAITNGDYSKENMEKLYKLSLKGLSAMKNAEGLDYKTYENVLQATYLSKLEKDKDGKIIAGTGVKVPANLAGCGRNDELSLIAEKAGKPNEVVDPNGHYSDKIRIYDGQAAKYYLKLDGVVKEYDNKLDRDEALRKFKEQYPNAKTEKWED